jgi:uncharacterized protein YndB with AHSA1/START domain
VSNYFEGECIMAIAEASVVINRPMEEVFAYVVDPKNTAQWAGPVIEAEKTSEGPVGLGTTSKRVTQFLGRTMEATYEITEFEPNSYYTDKTTSGPVPIDGRISFDSVKGGTKVTIEGEIKAAGFFKLAEPLLSRMAERQIATDVQTLKDLLEAQA